MTYNEWRDELKSNLLCVSDAERRRVLDYYAEAYADRREAGFSEREIIADFGAPYDAAQRILNESVGEGEQKSAPETRKEKAEANSAPAPTPPPQSQPQPKKSKSHGWAFVLFCIIFSIPIVLLIAAMVCVSVALIVAPFALVAAGATAIGGSIGIMISGDISYGLYILGFGFISLGAGVMLFTFFGKMIKFMWKVFKSVFSAIRNAFTGKESAV